jgi:hypothetical protein
MTDTQTEKLLKKVEKITNADKRFAGLTPKEREYIKLMKKLTDKVIKKLIKCSTAIICLTVCLFIYQMPYKEYLQDDLYIDGRTTYICNETALYKYYFLWILKKDISDKQDNEREAYDRKLEKFKKDAGGLFYGELPRFKKDNLEQDRLEYYYFDHGITTCFSEIMHKIKHRDYDFWNAHGDDTYSFLDFYDLDVAVFKDDDLFYTKLEEKDNG